MSEFTKEEYLTMRENFITVQEGHTHEIKSLKHRMKAVEDMTRELQEMNASLKLMVQKMNDHQDELEEQEQRIACLESEPAKKWNLVVNTIIGTVIGMLGTIAIQSMIH